MKYNLTISGRDYEILKNHLYPGDGKEALAVALCGRQRDDTQIRLLVHELILIPYENCERKPDLIKWSTAPIIPHLEKASKRNFGILKIHSHPTGYLSFSDTDNISDREFFSSIYGWMDNEEPHASAVMLPDGKIFGRIFHPNLTDQVIDKISVAGDDLQFWLQGDEVEFQEFQLRTAQAFGEGTTQKLNRLKVGVVGCSGTGSIVIEQLVRLGVGSLILVDPDVVEKKNLNRIINTTMNDAVQGSFKVDVIKKASERIGIGTNIEAFKTNLLDDIKAINSLAGCDIIFGCVDSIDGRHVLNQISTFYLIPYFDVGVKLSSDLRGGINQIQATVHYIQPGRSSLRTRGLYTEEELRAASLLRTNKDEYDIQKRNGYITNINVESPAVISINSQIASMAINEFLARLHSYRYDSNREFAVTRISFTDGYFMHEKEEGEDTYLSKFVGRGDLKPLLNMPELN